MIFNKHSELGDNDHAFLSPSNYHWVNYDLEKLTTAFKKRKAKEEGIRFHAFAKEAILLGVKLPKTRTTLNLFVNDAIGFRMTPEQPIFYSYNAFGTADAISYDERKRKLRIHDLKTGETKASMTQLELYAAYFCLEYDINPHDIEIELRIYQYDDIQTHVPEPESIMELMEITVWADNHISSIK